MKNIIFIDAINNCKCDLVSNVDDGTNRLVLEIKTDVSKNPKLEINSTDVPIASGNFIYEVPSSLYIGSGTLQFRIKDDDHIGDWFTVSKVAKIDGNLFLKQNSNFIYTLRDIVNAQGSATTVSVRVGKTQTLPPGHDATVVNSGDDKNVVLDFNIPRGPDGKTPQMMIDEHGHLIAIYDD